MSNILLLKSEYDQSAWLDYLDRNLLVGGGLQELIASGLRGVTSNPTIFHKAITGSNDYDDTIRDLLQGDPEVEEEILYEWLAIQDIQRAADILKPVYESSEGADGFVCLEVSPHLAFDTSGTIDAARHLWRAVGRPNLMIKVPGTSHGIPAIESLIAEGINVNVTLLFSVERYKEVVQAHIRGLEQNIHPEDVASVASFFVSRVDTKVDALLDEAGSTDAQKLKGCIAIANAKMAYQHFRETLGSSDWETQHRRGARPQRPLWASTGTKNPEYSDVLYVEQLIGSQTVNTMTPDTLDAFQAHGELYTTLEMQVDVARKQLEALVGYGISLARVTEELEQEGVDKFADSHDKLLAALKDKRFAVAEHFAEK
ncbi:transaldolase [Kineobactrum sediminis]|uniref:Transaldolase n=1 Tax=Kineobactrum sediminis TaxID=1905677 RepID=A0A2N5XYY3_9GAMM|nr:transaldolase [Kineobactrum sediminis]PLW81351.1 transaldolase [Kineobactrum sediminis]